MYDICVFGACTVNKLFYMNKDRKVKKCKTKK